MKKILNWLLPLVMLSAIFGGTVFFINSNAGAKAETVPNIESPQIVQPESISPQTEQKQLSISEQVGNLTEKGATNYRKAGWIHMVTHQTLNSDTQNTAPDGTVAPNEYITDDWILLDNNGNEVQGVFLQRNMQGNIIQVSVLKDKAWHNLTYGDIIPAPDTLIFTPDFGFSEMAVRLKDTLEKGTVNIKGKKLTKFIAKENYQKPSKFLEFNSPVTSINTEAIYDDTGIVTLYQTVFMMQDGSERIRDSVEIVTMETVIEPPFEILNYLNIQ